MQHAEEFFSRELKRHGGSLAFHDKLQRFDPKLHTLISQGPVDRGTESFLALCEEWRLEVERFKKKKHTAENVARRELLEMALVVLEGNIRLDVFLRYDLSGTRFLPCFLLREVKDQVQVVLARRGVGESELRIIHAESG